MRNGQLRQQESLPGRAGGGTAIVYAAIDTALGRHVALKVMQPQAGKATVNIVAVRREIQYASKAKHPNIVALLDVFVELERLVIVVRFRRLPLELEKA